MRHITQHYIDGRFVDSHGCEQAELLNPATEAVIGTVTLGDREDARAAIAAARRAWPAMARTDKAERLAMLQALQNAVAARADEINAANTEEYGGPVSRAAWVASHAVSAFQHAATVLRDYPLVQRIGQADVVMAPVGVAGLITPWNSNAGFICSKLASAVAAGCTAVIKPSEMSALQTQGVVEALHAAGLPAGVFNIVNGRGEVVGDEITRHPEVDKISFTGSTAVGQGILRTGADTMKRVTLELGGKSPTVVLPDADLALAMPLAIAAGFQNSGQACIAGSRILVPRARLAEAERLAAAAVSAMKVGDPRDPATQIGPMVSRRQWERVQRYIRQGQADGARLVVGGEGRPEGLARGFFVRPTLFADVRNDMVIAREEIFGPVLCLIGYEDEDDAIALANDTPYGLQALVISASDAHARAVALQLRAGRVLINGLHHEPLAPFGGFKASGLGREFGRFGLEAYLEPMSVIGA